MSTVPAVAPPGAPTTPPTGTPPAHTDQPNWSGYTRVALVMAVAGWALFGIVGFANLGAAESEAAKHDAKSRFMVAYLSGWVYWLSLPVGALALLMIRYVAKTSWGLLLTRPFEAATRTLPLTMILFLPVIGAVAYEVHDEKDPTKHSSPFSPYWWSNPSHAPTEDVHIDPNAAPGDHRAEAVALGKTHMNKAIANRQEDERQERDENIYGYLSLPGLLLNSAIVFGIWGALIFFLNKWGKETSAATDPRVVDRGLEKMQNISGPGLVIFAIVTTSAATQWVMSLEPGWSSTMFPVIFAVNTFLTTMAFGVSMFLLIAHKPPFAGFMRPKFQLDMATLMLVFTLFWSYTSFSQFMLVWIGNLPEEIPFYLKRSNEHGHRSFWWGVSAALIALHFALPFILLLFRSIKLHPKRLRCVALYLMVICAVDVIWWIAPSAPAHGHFPSYLMDVGAVLGMGGLWLMYFVYQLKQRPIFPDNQAFLLPEGHVHGH